MWKERVKFKSFLLILFVKKIGLYEWVKREWEDRARLREYKNLNSTYFTILPKAGPELSSPRILEIRPILKNQQPSLNIDEQEREYVRME